MNGGFAHLHVHSEYSMLDGAARLKDMFAEAQRLGMSAVAISDHGNMHGAYDFFKQARAAGITPVVGIEAYVAPASRFDKKRISWGRPDQKRDDISGNGAFTHMTMWARNATGLHNLFRLSSLASIEGFYQKPRMDADLISEHSSGIMATTGCPSGEVQTRLRLGQDAEALEVAARYQDIFGKEHYFLELMDHGLDIERRVRAGLLDIGRKLGIPPVVTNDSHYTFASQRDAHDALLCIQTGSNLSDPNRFKFDGSGYYLKSAEEMYGIDQSDSWQEGCANTLVVAERVEMAGMFEHRNLMPRFPVPDGDTEEEFLSRMVAEGLARLYPDGVPADRRARADFELGIINSMGFAGYFLVTQDLMNWARGQGIRCGVRGSAVGSLVAYAIGIHGIEPMTYGLLFERLLNPERVSMPDIDMDFDERRRGEVIGYATRQYGADRIAQIATMTNVKAKNAVKDAARLLGHPFSMGDKITKAMPPDVMGKGVSLTGMFDPKHPRYAEAAEFRALCQSEPAVQKTVDVATGLEGLKRGTGVHAAGVIMASAPLIDHIPVMRRDSDGAIITQFEYPQCEELGLLKMDFLGLSNYTIIDDAVNNIKANRGVELNLDDLPLDDPAAFELLARGDTSGVFQLDGGGMRSLLRSIQPTEFAHISAVLALYRPGPMGANSHNEYADRKTGRKPVVPIHPELAEALAEILDETYGLIVYQEQVMAIAVKLAGYTVGAADLLRKAMGKKNKAVLDKEFIPFRDGMKSRGYGDDAVKTLWDILIPFADYAFNKAHTTAYGYIAYWTAYLKANYPTEYMAALLTGNADDKAKLGALLAEARHAGVKVLPPDVNSSAFAFTPVGEDIRFGLGAVRNVGANVVASIVAARESKGKFSTFNDFLSKVDLVVCNKRLIESLIKAGAFDELGHTRRDLIANHDMAIDAVVTIKRNEAKDQFDLFSGFGDGKAAGEDPFAIPLVLSGEEWAPKEKLAFEREMLGMYVSAHPLDGCERILKANREQVVADILDEETPDRKPVTLAGMIAGVTRKITKNGAQWAIVNLEDMTGSVEVLFFPKAYEVFAGYLIADEVVAVNGHVSRRDGAVSVFGNDLAILEVSAAAVGGAQPVVLSSGLEKVTPAWVEDLKRVLAAHPGDAPVHMRLQKRDRTQLVLALGPDVKVANTPAFRSEIKVLLGAGGIE